MKRIFKQFRKKIIPNLFLLLLTIQNLFPLSILFSSSAQAQLHLDTQVVSVDFDTSTYELSLMVAEPLALDYLVEYQDGEGVIQAVQGKTELTIGGSSAEVYLGVCSATDCIHADFETGKLIFPNTDYQADFIYRNGSFWLMENGVATVETVELGKTYTAPQNDQVQVTFTQLPENPGFLSIQEVYLNDEQVEALGALSNVAYDITSDMENGTFQYELKLPVTDSNTGEVQIKYAESVEELDQAIEVVVEKNGNEVVAKELNHFTVFVVTFETPDYTTGNINGQDGWFKTGLFDSVVDSSYGVSGFGNQSLRISNAITSGSFGDQTFAKPLIDAVGEVDATAGSFSEGNRQTHFEMEFDIASTMLDWQPGMFVSVSPDRGDGSRMSYLSFEDTATGIDVTFYDVQGENAGFQLANFVPTDLGELNRNSSHHIKLVMDVVDGASNDVVKVYIDGSLVHTGTSWENYYRFDTEASAEQSPRIVRTILFRVSGSAAPANLGKGYLFDNISLMSGPDIVKDIHFTNTGTPVIGGSTSSINLEVNATYPTYGVDRVRFRYAPPGETCKAQYTSPYFNNIGDGTKNGDLYSIDWDVTGLPSGEYTVCALMHRGSGAGSEGYKDENHAEFKVVVDNTAPAAPTNLRRYIKGTSTELACGVTTQRQTLIPIWNENTESDFAHYEYSSFNPGGSQGINEEILYTNEKMHSWMPPTDGTYGFTVRAVDKAGNKSVWSLSGENLAGSCQITYDSTPPATPTGITIKNSDGVDIGCGGFVNQRYITVDWNDSLESDFDHYLYDIKDNENFKSLKVSKNSGNIRDEDGLYKYRVKVVDKAGNVSEPSPWCEVTLDRVSPTVDLVFPTPGPTAKNFQAVFSENVKKAEAENPANYYLSNWPGAGGSGDLVGDVSISYDESSKTATVNFLNAGWYVSPEQKWGVQNIHDLAGNLQTVNPYEEYSTPMVAPATIDLGIDSAWHSMAVSFDLLCSDVSGSGCNKTYYTTDGSNPTTGSLFGNSVTINTEGVFTIKYFSTDRAGNVETVKTASNNVKIDWTAPTSTITSYGLGNGGEVETNTFDGLIEGIATDAGSGVDHVLLSVGHYSFEDGPAGQKYWDKDAATWVVGEVLFQANGADTWSYQLPDVPEGVYTITSHAVDVAGNQEATFVITIVYDKTIPEVTLTIDPSSPDAENGWYKTLPTITLTATDNYQTDKIEYHWNSDGWSTYTDSLTPPSEGQNILYYRGVDKVGNTTAVGVKEVKYDATAPVDGPLNVKVENITLDSAIGKWEKPATSSDITRYVLSWKHESGDSNGIEVGSNIFEHEMKSLYNGEWTFIVKAMDNAGNFKESAVKFRIGPPVGGTSSTSEETVLGVIDETGETTSPTGQVAGVVTTADETSEKTEEQTTDNSEEGQVLGEIKEQCTGVTSNLPWLLLAIQFALMGLSELLFKNADKKIRKTIFWGLALLMPVVFYLSRNEACYSAFVYNWFVLPSLGATVLARLVSYFFIEEIA